MKNKWTKSDLDSEDIERMFYNDTRYKKRVASGVQHKTGKRGYTGVIRTTSDYMSNKEKKKLNGEVKVSFMEVKDLLKLEEIRAKKPEEAKKIIKNYYNNFSTKELKLHFGLSGHGFYKLLEEHGVELKTKRAGKEDFSKIKNIKSMDEIMEMGGIEAEYYIKDLKKKYQVKDIVKYLGIDQNRWTRALKKIEIKAKAEKEGNVNRLHNIAKQEALEIKKIEEEARKAKEQADLEAIEAMAIVKETPAAIVEEIPVEVTEAPIVEVELEQAIKEVEEVLNEFSIKIKGKFDLYGLKDKITRICRYLDEDSLYKVDIDIKEIEKA